MVRIRPDSLVSRHQRGDMLSCWQPSCLERVLGGCLEACVLPRASGADWRTLGDYTVRLCLFSTAAFKALDPRLAAISLLCEGYSVLRLLGRLQVGPVHGSGDALPMQHGLHAALHPAPQA